MMELCHITAGYGGPPVLRDVSLAFEPGKVTVLAGPNGCGKSTLLRVAARLMAPERGEVRIEGQDVSRLSAKQFARLAALLPQSRPLPGITAGSLVLHGRFPYLGYPRRYSREDREAARQAMERTGVAGLEGVPMAHLSGGQRQKVYLAMALAVFIKLFIIGYPSDAYIITYTDINGSQVRVGGSFYNSASVFSRYKMVRKDDGTEEMVVYACLASPWNRNGTFNLEMGLPAEGMQMDIRGMTVKSNGEVVGRQANELFKAKNPYIGDASADGKLAGLVGISKSLGVFKNQLQTSEEPYGWTLNFEDSTSNSATFEEKMKAFSCMLIALTGNLGEVQWNYTVELEDGPVQRSGRMTEAECSEYVGAPVKSFADSPEGVQALLDLLEISDR